MGGEGGREQLTTRAQRNFGGDETFLYHDGSDGDVIMFAKTHIAIHQKEHKFY